VQTSGLSAKYDGFSRECKHTNGAAWPTDVWFLKNDCAALAVAFTQISQRNTPMLLTSASAFFSFYFTYYEQS